MPIRVRLALAGVAVAALALVLFGLLADRLVSYSAPREQDQKLAALAERTVASLRRAAPASLRAGLSPAAEDVDSTTEPFVVVLDRHGHVLYASARVDAVARALVVAARKGSHRATVRSPRGIELRLALRPWERPDLATAGVVVAGQAKRFATKQVSDFRAFLIVSGVVALIIAGLATWVVSGRALRPLRQLAATADEIGRTGDLSRRLRPRRSKDVLGALTASFNGMLDRLAATQRRLEEALDTQRRFVADASHELRNPLTTIRSNAGFLQERGDAAEQDRREALADIAVEGERMGRIVDDLLTLARADAGHPFERGPVDLASALQEAAYTRRTDRPVRLELDGEVVALCDADAIRQLVAILVDNAARHGAGQIELRLARADGGAVLTVTDRGPGIPESDLERIFERFYQADPARSAEGAGLGLAIARSIAVAHGGSVRAANRPGGGAVFTVELPLAG